MLSNIIDYKCVQAMNDSDLDCPKKNRFQTMSNIVSLVGKLESLPDDENPIRTSRQCQVTRDVASRSQHKFELPSISPILLQTTVYVADDDCSMKERSARLVSQTEQNYEPIRDMVDRFLQNDKDESGSESSDDDSSMSQSDSESDEDNQHADLRDDPKNMQWEFS